MTRRKISVSARSREPKGDMRESIISVYFNDGTGSNDRKFPCCWLVLNPLLKGSTRNSRPTPAGKIAGSVPVSVTNGCLTITQCDTTQFLVLRDSFWCQIDQSQAVAKPALTALGLDCGNHHVYGTSKSLEGLGLHIFFDGFTAGRLPA